MCGLVEGVFSRKFLLLYVQNGQVDVSWNWGQDRHSRIKNLAIYACTTMNDKRFLCPCRLANNKLIVNTNTLTRASPMAPHGALPALHMCNADGDVRATRTLQCLDVQRHPEGCVPWCT